MAWYAELKRRKWYCINQFDAIKWYKKYLYDEWYNSLTDEQKERLEEYRRKKKEKTEKEAQEALLRLVQMTAMVSGLANRNSSKYHGLYDDNGFPNEDFFKNRR